ncbi:hypothetical protein N7486_001018 [Penicillium sp. IBT 16267x]|nr:hypothetical protein N7486_001018 [Penicillium sp. IBT 16267x]
MAPKSKIAPPQRYDFTRPALQIGRNSNQHSMSSRNNLVEPPISLSPVRFYEPSSNTLRADLDIGSHYKVFDVNIMHPIKMSRIAIRRLRHAQKPGVILHISSITAQIPSIVNPLYSDSKQAVSQFVRCMAPLDDLAVVDTPLFRDSAKARAHIDLENDYTLPPEEVVKAMMSLVTTSRYPSGTMLEIGDIGGWRGAGLFNDPGPRERSTLPRPKAKGAIKLETALVNDAGAIYK